MVPRIDHVFKERLHDIPTWVFVKRIAKECQSPRASVLSRENNDPSKNLCSILAGRVSGKHTRTLATVGCVPIS